MTVKNNKEKEILLPNINPFNHHTDQDQYVPVHWVVEIYDPSLLQWKRGIIQGYCEKLNKIQFQSDSCEKEELFGELHLIKMIESKVKDNDGNDLLLKIFLQKNGYRERENIADIPNQDRQHENLKEISRLNEMISVLEKYGEMSVGILSRPMTLNFGKKNNSLNPPEGTIDTNPCTEILHEVYDENGVGIFERLLKCHIRLVAQTQLRQHNHKQLDYCHAEIELAEVYLRMGLWKQAFIHAKKAKIASQQHDNSEDTQMGSKSNKSNEVHILKTKIFSIDGSNETFNYHDISSKLQNNQKVINFLKLSKGLKNLLIPDKVESMFQEMDKNKTGIIQWQQFLQFLNFHDSMFQSYVKNLEESLPYRIHYIVKELYSNGKISETKSMPVNEFESCKLWSLISPKAHKLIKENQRISWSEVLEYTGVIDIHWEIECLQTRIMFILGKYYIKIGSLDEALENTRQACIKAENLFGQPHILLADCCQALGESLVLKHQEAIEIARDKAEQSALNWISKPEGSRKHREKTLEIISQAKEEFGEIIYREEAEKRARNYLLSQQKDIEFISPDNQMIEEALELFVKACGIREKHYGNNHVEVAYCFLALGNLNIIRNNLKEAVKYLEQAVRCYTDSFDQATLIVAALQVYLGRLHQRMMEYEEACVLFHQAANFYTQRAKNFPDWDSTRKMLCEKAIQSWKYWLQLQKKNKNTKDQIQAVLEGMLLVASMGYGDYSIEAAIARRNLGKYFVKTGKNVQGRNLMKISSQIFRANFGPKDQRSRKIHKELMTIKTDYPTKSNGNQSAEEVSDEDWDE